MTSQNNHGFTLLEILLTITIVTILTGIILTIINPVGSNNRARSTVHLATLLSLGESMDAIRVAEGRYPEHASSGDPFQGTDAAMISRYINRWPANPDVTFNYYKHLRNAREFICISVVDMSQDRASCPFFSYISPFDPSVTGGNPDCIGVVLRCPMACSTDLSSIDLNQCETLERVNCAPSGPHVCAN